MLQAHRQKKTDPAAAGSLPCAIVISIFEITSAFADRSAVVFARHVGRAAYLDKKRMGMSVIWSATERTRNGKEHDLPLVRQDAEVAAVSTPRPSPTA